MSSSSGLQLAPQACGLGGELKRDATGDVIQDVAHKVSGATEYRLRTVTAVGGVYPSIIKNADIVNAPIGFNKVIPKHVHVIVIDVDG